MLKKILIGAAIVIALFLIVVSLQPAEFKVERSATLAAPPAAVFAQVNDFRNWANWSPWEKMEANEADLKKTYGAVTAGEGATYAWEGKKTGAGMMTITNSDPHGRIDIRLEFLKPFKAVNPTAFTFAPEGEATRVTWTMSGKNNFIGKAMCLFMDMDKMVGGDFEKGLAAMEKAAQANPVEAPAENGL
jgi:carbon monoxide dehydrogenase subunit G